MVKVKVSANAGGRAKYVKLQVQVLYIIHPSQKINTFELFVLICSWNRANMNQGPHSNRQPRRFLQWRKERQIRAFGCFFGSIVSSWQIQFAKNYHKSSGSFSYRKKESLASKETLFRLVYYKFGICLLESRENWISLTEIFLHNAQDLKC